MIAVRSGDQFLLGSLQQQSFNLVGCRILAAHSAIKHKAAVVVTVLKVLGRQAYHDAALLATTMWHSDLLGPAAAVHSALHMVSELCSCFCRGRAESLFRNLASVRCSQGCSRPASAHLTPPCFEEATTFSAGQSSKAWTNF